jgi:hypothetical protein
MREWVQNMPIFLLNNLTLLLDTSTNLVKIVNDMAQEKRRAVKRYIRQAKKWLKHYGRHHGSCAWVQTECGTISNLELAVRYLIIHGYPFKMYYGTSSTFRTCGISID